MRLKQELNASRQCHCVFARSKERLAVSFEQELTARQLFLHKARGHISTPAPSGPILFSSPVSLSCLPLFLPSLPCLSFPLFLSSCPLSSPLLSPPLPPLLSSLLSSPLPSSPPLLSSTPLSLSSAESR